MGGSRATIARALAIVLCGALSLSAASKVGAAAARWTPIADQGSFVEPFPRLDPAVARALAGLESSLGNENVALRLAAPDGRKVAVYHRLPSSRFAVALVMSNRTTPIKPVNTDLDVGGIAWRPDSAALTLVTWQPGSPGSTVWQYDVDAGQFSRHVRFDRQIAYAPVWNKLGDTLAMLASDEAHTGDRHHGNLVLIDQGGVVTQLTKEFAAVSPSWAPSGRRIAVGNESPIGRPNSRSGVTVYSIEGSKVRHESPPRPPQADDDLQIDRVIWQADETILVRFSVFRGSDTPPGAVQWYRLVLQ